MSNVTTILNRQTRIGEIAGPVRRVLRKAIWPATIVLGLEAAYLGMSSDPGAGAFALISLANVLALAVWAKSGEGLPIIPVLLFENLLIYGLPLAMHNETVMSYPGQMLTEAGIEVFIFTLAIIGAWRIGMEIIPESTRSCYALIGIDECSPKVARLGMAMVLGATAYKLLGKLGLMDIVTDLLPGGSGSILTAVISSVSACGFFVGGMMLGRGSLSPPQRFAFWGMLLLQSYIEASGFLLSATTVVLFSVIIGVFWGSGRLPWRLILVVAVALSFLNLGKFTMRDRYWSANEDEPTPNFSFTSSPRYYGEWMDASWSALTGTAEQRDMHNAFAVPTPNAPKTDSGQSMLERIDNLQNLLFVVDAVQYGNIRPLGGDTYMLIPPLFVPRILWPDKPRTHQGQEMLNVHFGRQTLEATFRTYVAWGLLPEAYGNFGRVTGAIVLGAFLGLIFAWVEKFSAPKLVMSTEGFLSFTLLLGMANSFEMVTSVLVTSLFQAFIPVVLASAPFVRRTTVPRTVAATQPTDAE